MRFGSISSRFEGRERGEGTRVIRTEIAVCLFGYELCSSQLYRLMVFFFNTQIQINDITSY